MNIAEQPSRSAKPNRTDPQERAGARWPGGRGHRAASTAARRARRIRRAERRRRSARRHVPIELFVAGDRPGLGQAEATHGDSSDAASDATRASAAAKPAPARPSAAAGEEQASMPLEHLTQASRSDARVATIADAAFMTTGIAGGEVLGDLRRRRAHLREARRDEREAEVGLRRACEGIACRWNRRTRGRPDRDRRRRPAPATARSANAS